jgi:hypothetical protein
MSHRASLEIDAPSQSPGDAEDGAEPEDPFVVVISTEKNKHSHLLRLFFLCKAHRFKIIAAIVVVFSIAFFIPYGLANIPCTDVFPAGYAQPILYPGYVNSSHTYQVVLFGDSMVGYPAEHYALAAKLQGYLPQFNINVTVSGHSGSNIKRLCAAKLEHMLYNATVQGHIDVLLMMWDSDVSDEAWNIKDEDVVYKKQQYIANLTPCIRRILSAKPDTLVALAGPVVYGEGPLFAPLRRYSHVYDYHLYASKYEEFRGINRALCDAANITYIDVRRAFVDLAPRYRLGFRGCFTDNGQHENDRGARIAAREFATALVHDFKKTRLWS